MKKILDLHRWCNAREWLLILLIVVVVLRIPTLVTPHFYGDEEIYFVMGRAWREGVPLYEAMFDHKPPLIYVMAGIFSNVPLFRGMLLFSMLLHTFLFWQFLQRFWGEKHRILAKLSSVIFVLLTTLPTLEGHIVNAELLMMLPVTASLLLIWPKQKNSTPDTSSGRYLVAGLVAGIGWLYKIPVVFDFIAVTLYVFVFSQATLWKSLKSIFTLKFWFFVGGFVTPLIMTFAYYYLKGHGASYLATVFTVNLGYVSSWKSDSFTTFNPFKSGLVVRGLMVAGYTLVLYIFRKKLDRRLLFAGLWSGWSLFGALLSYRPYPHYLQEIVPAVSLLVPTLFTTASVTGWLLWAALITVAIVTQRDVKFWGYAIEPLYRDYYQLIRNKIDNTVYQNRFDNAERNYSLASYINSRIKPKDKIFIWGSDPTVYNLTNTLPAGGKYIVSFHIRDLRKYDYVMENLRNVKPQAIILQSRNDTFPELEAMLEVSYIEVYKKDEAVVLWRIDDGE